MHKNIYPIHIEKGPCGGRLLVSGLYRPSSCGPTHTHFFFLQNLASQIANQLISGPPSIVLLPCVTCPPVPVAVQFTIGLIAIIAKLFRGMRKDICFMCDSSQSLSNRRKQRVRVVESVGVIVMIGIRFRGIRGLGGVCVCE
jgi:hypothetical protein